MINFSSKSDFIPFILFPFDLFRKIGWVCKLIQYNTNFFLQIVQPYIPLFWLYCLPRSWLYSGQERGTSNLSSLEIVQQLFYKIIKCNKHADAWYTLMHAKVACITCSSGRDPSWFIPICGSTGYFGASAQLCTSARTIHMFHLFTHSNRGFEHTWFNIEFTK